MSHRPEGIKSFQKRDEVKKELENNMEDGQGDTAGGDIKADRLPEYENRLESLKEELKALKKLKKRQEKISKLEEEKMDVIQEIERRKNDGRKSRRHNRH